mgnify:CR=1 FL=1
MWKFNIKNDFLIVYYIHLMPSTLNIVRFLKNFVKLKTRIKAKKMFYERLIIKIILSLFYCFSNWKNKKWYQLFIDLITIDLFDKSNCKELK